MAANGMITRHFEHPSGATATLEMPAGWSRNPWYEFSINGGKPERWQFANAIEARAAAVARERTALANGWKPRMAASIETSQVRDWSIHRPTGERLPLQITEIRDTSETVSALSPFMGGRIVRSKTIDFTAVGQTMLQAGDRFLIQQRELAKSNVLAAFLAERVSRQHELSGVVTNHIKATMTAMEPEESEAIEQWHDREAIIQAGVETNTSLVELWDWLGTRIQATTERQQVQAAIIRGRAERQARLQREQEIREMRERTQAEQEAQHTREMLRRQIESLQIRPMSRAQQTDEALRRLSGGVDLNKPKKRKIDLGE